MANTEHKNKLTQGVQEWNNWRDKNSKILPDLSELDMTKLGIDLQGYNFKMCNLTKAVFYNMNLKDADFRDSILIDANLSDVKGLTAKKFAGANLSGAILPEGILDSLKSVALSANVSAAQRDFLTLIAGCIYSLLTISSTTALELLTNSTFFELPIISVKIPVISFYYVTPIILIIIYFYFSLSLQRISEMLALMPAIFPDDIELNLKSNIWLLSSLVQKSFPCLKKRPFRLAWLQSWLSLISIRFIMPLTFLYFLFSSIQRHDISLTKILYTVFIISIISSFYFHYIQKKTLKSNINQFSKLSYKNLTILIMVIAAIAILGIADFSFKKIANMMNSKVDFLWMHSYAKIETRELENKKRFLFNKNKFKTSEKCDAKIDLINLEAAGMSLPQADFNCLYCQNANFYKADLKEADFSGANLESADFSQAYLSNTQFIDTKCNKAKFESSQLQEAKFFNADCNDAQFSRANLNKAKFNNANLHNATFYGSTLTEAQFVNAKLQKAQFYYGADLKHANFTLADLTEASITTKIDLKYALLRKAILDKAQLNDVNLSDATLEETKFKNANLTNVIFIRNKLIKADFHSSTVNETDFIGVDLTDANLSNTTMKKTNFFASILKTVNFQKAILKECSLLGADLTGADLRGADFSTVIEMTKQQLDSVRFKDDKTKLPPYLQE